MDLSRFSRNSIRALLLMAIISQHAVAHCEEAQPNNPPPNATDAANRTQNPDQTRQTPPMPPSLRGLIDQPLFDPTGENVGSIYDLIKLPDGTLNVVIKQNEQTPLLVAPLSFVVQNQQKWTILLPKKNFEDAQKTFSYAPAQTTSLRVWRARATKCGLLEPSAKQ